MTDGIRCEICFHRIKDLSFKLEVDGLRVCPDCYDLVIDKDKEGAR